MHKIVITMHTILPNVERMNKKYTVKLIQDKIFYEDRSSDSWFRSYGQLAIKENVHECPCRHGRRETSGTLLCSTTSDWGLWPLLAANSFPQKLQNVDLLTGFRMRSTNNGAPARFFFL